MIFSKWLAIWANGNTRWDAGSWPNRQEVDGQVDRTSEWRGSGGEALFHKFLEQLFIVIQGEFYILQVCKL